VTTTRTRVAATLVMCAFVFLFAAPNVLADPSEPKPIRCLADAAFNDWGDGMYWKGDVHGCILAGSIRVTELPAVFPGTTEHFFEEFEITAGTEVISGTDAGVWSFVTYKFRANGWVREATPGLHYLVGYKVHMSGVTSPWPGELPITTDDMEMRFVAP